MSTRSTGPRIRPGLKAAIIVDRPIYAVELEHTDVELLAAGKCSERLAAFAHRLLRWQRTAIRATTPAPVPRRRR